MALNPVLSDLISEGAQIADQLLEMRGTLDKINILYDSQGGFKSTITPEDETEIDTVFNGLTKAQLDDALYVLTATIKDNLSTALTALVQLAARNR